MRFASPALSALALGIASPASALECIDSISTGFVFSESFRQDVDEVATYEFCPDTNLTVDEAEGGSPFVIFNPRIRIKCGPDGRRSDNCIVKGNDVSAVFAPSIFVTRFSQTGIVENWPPFAGAPPNRSDLDPVDVEFHGMTFAGGVPFLYANAPTSVTFRDCAFLDGTIVGGSAFIMESEFPTAEPTSSPTTTTTPSSAPSGAPVASTRAPTTETTKPVDAVPSVTAAPVDSGTDVPIEVPSAGPTSTMMPTVTMMPVTAAPTSAPTATAAPTDPPSVEPTAIPTASAMPTEPTTADSPTFGPTPPSPTFGPTPANSSAPPTEAPTKAPLAPGMCDADNPCPDPANPCCSNSGFCGSTPAYCGPGNCQSGCTNATLSPTESPADATGSPTESPANAGDGNATGSPTESPTSAGDGGVAGRRALAAIPPRRVVPAGFPRRPPPPRAAGRRRSLASEEDDVEFSFIFEMCDFERNVVELDEDGMGALVLNFGGRVEFDGCRFADNGFVRPDSLDTSLETITALVASYVGKVDVNSSCFTGNADLKTIVSVDSFSDETVVSDNHQSGNVYVETGSVAHCEGVAYVEGFDPRESPNVTCETEGFGRETCAMDGTTTPTDSPMTTDAPAPPVTAAPSPRPVSVTESPTLRPATMEPTDPVPVLASSAPAGAVASFVVAASAVVAAASLV